MVEASSLYETATDEELVCAVNAGKVEVFAELYKRYYPRVYRLAYGMTGRHDAAEDLSQEIFIRTYHKVRLFKGQSTFATWFYRLAFNHCVNRCKSDSKWAKATVNDLGIVSSDQRTTPVDKLLLQKQVQDQIHRALQSLKPRARLIVILRDIEGLSYEEIADRMNCSIGTLASQLKRARNLLARKLEHLRGTF